MSFKINTSVNLNIGILKREYSPSIPEISACWISDWMEKLLKTIANARLGPTVTSRWLFIASNCIYNSYQFVTVGKNPVDLQYWSSNEKGVNNSSLQSWMEYSCQYFFPMLVTEYMKLSFDSSDLIEKHKPLQQIDENSFNLLKNLINNYLLARDSDGWKDVNNFPTSEYPNGSNFISADNSISQNLNTLPEIYKWTPLKFGSSLKTYLTPGWGSVNKGILSDSEFGQLIESTSELFPSTSTFLREVEDVKNVTATLTDKEKMSAEFWAGGPGTVTPPGMWIVFADLVIRCNSMTIENEIKIYTIISSGIYQAGICAWKLKRQFLQARPIQMIRELDYGHTITSWQGSISGDVWLPYQELDFVTPPFPDFVSGHSTFSSTCSRLLSYILETDVISLKNPTITNNIVNYLSPVLTNSSVNFCMNDVFIYPDTSKVQTTPYIPPLSGVLLNWTNWSDMAKDSGRSRIYGGIHVESSNQAGLFLGRKIGDKLWNIFKNL
jgi:hypothetical protein